MKRYNSLNGIRTIACLGIVLMHVKSNLPYDVSGNYLNLIINELGNLTILFMVLSSFSMCCGYYEKIKNTLISPEQFYGRRVKKILPFFALLVFLDVIIEHNLSSIIEGFADLTLMFGFLSRNMQVLGVAWFLGLVFIFYMIFPFFFFFFSNKKKAWFVTFVSAIMNFISTYYFEVGRINMFYSFIFFCIGGLIYLYKDSIIKILNKNRIISLMILIISIIIYFVIPNNDYLFTIRILPMCIMLLAYAISFDSKILDNKFTGFISSISLEIYLCHMVMFRIVEKLQLLKLIDNNLCSYFFVYGLVLIGAIGIAIGFKVVWNYVEKKVFRRENIISE